MYALVHEDCEHRATRQFARTTNLKGCLFVDACFTWALRPCQRVRAVAGGEVRLVNRCGPQKSNQRAVTQANFAVAGEPCAFKIALD